MILLSKTISVYFDYLENVLLSSCRAVFFLKQIENISLVTEQYALVDKMTAAPLHFPGVCEDDLDKFFERLSRRFILKQLDYLLSISSCDS